jgi:transcription elongation factor Elf1
MNLSNPNLIRKLVACPETQLSKVAKENKVNPAIATVIRDHWICRVKGICARCGRHLSSDRCENCGTVAISSITLLEVLGPTTVLVRMRCRTCNKSMTYLVKDVLQMVKRYGSFRPNSECPQCKREKTKNHHKEPVTQPPKAVKPITPLKEKAPLSKKEKKVETTEATSTVDSSKEPVATPAPVIKADVPPRPLTYRPFADLQGLKIEKQA